MGCCGSSEADREERERLIDNERRAISGGPVPQSMGGGAPGRSHSVNIGLDGNGHGGVGGVRGASGGANRPADVLPANHEATQLAAEAALKEIVARAEKGFIDLQDAAHALQPASMEESRFFGHLESLPPRSVGEHKAAFFALPLASRTVHDDGIANCLAAPDPIESFDVNFDNLLNGLVDAVHNVPVESKGELIAFFPRSLADDKNDDDDDNNNNNNNNNNNSSSNNAADDAVVDVQ
eukprot:TRINITY_DN577_c0_g1_i1.p2 TRINITY_DN577_c0_g1~~TRINITY_DN577_c0_g1_i1.p2  ORF type:complete len:238 (-),score=89.73 TRINITY_DN577_c0_g1_i1:110-823(-)